MIGNNSLQYFLTILLLCLLNTTSAGRITYTTVKKFRMRWKDVGSKAKDDVTLWKPYSDDVTVFFLGDVATKGHWKPTAPTSVAVKSDSPSALIVPTGVSLVWANYGSSASGDVLIYRMNAPEGYTCLGDVMSRSFTSPVDISRYRCVKNDYLIEAGGSREVWSNEGSDAEYPVSLVKNLTPSKKFSGGNQIKSANTFYAVSNFSPGPTQRSSKILNTAASGMQRSSSSYTPGFKPINIYKINHAAVKLWDTRGTNTSDVSVWRTPSQYGLYNIGDFAVNHFNPVTTSYLVKATDRSALTIPTFYREVCRVVGSQPAVRIWRAACPSHYIALGNVLTYGNYPAIDALRCIKTAYTSVGQWEYVWSYANGGSPCAIYNAYDPNETSRSFQLMSAVQSLDASLPPQLPHILDSQMVNRFTEKPIALLKVWDVRYQLSKAQTINHPAKLAVKTFINQEDWDKHVEQEIPFTKVMTSTWLFNSIHEEDLPTELRAGIPVIHAATTRIYPQRFLKVKSGRKKISLEKASTAVNEDISPHYALIATVRADQYSAKIPFQATVEKVYFDGTRTLHFGVSGVFEGVQMNNIWTNYEWQQTEDMIEPLKNAPLNAALIATATNSVHEPGFTDWYNVGTCSVTCGLGWQKKTRACKRPPCDRERKRFLYVRCERPSCGFDVDPKAKATSHLFEVIGDPGPWMKEGECSRKCGQGLQTWVRRCTPRGSVCPTWMKKRKTEPCIGECPDQSDLTCNELPTEPNNNVEQVHCDKGTSIGSLCIVTCSPGHYLDGAPYLVCQFETEEGVGKWNNPEPHCRPLLGVPRIFRTYLDTDNSGGVTSEEVFHAYAEVDIILTSTQLEYTFSVYDVDNNDNITIEEFTNGLAHEMNDGEASFLNVFKIFDINGDGYVTPHEYLHKMQLLGTKLTDQQSEDIIAKADKNNDGKTGFMELGFLTVINKTTW